MKAFIVVLALAAIVLGTLTGRYLNRATVKIDEDVTIVTLGNRVIVMQRGQTPRVTRVRAAPKTVKAPKPGALVWTLPYTCADARYYGSHFTKAQLEAMRVAAKMPMPTAGERAQIQACLAGRLQ